MTKRRPSNLWSCLFSQPWGGDYANIDTLEVFPEFRVGSGKVDYALQNEGKPLVFVECKRWSISIEMEEPQDQVARYIFQEGVDLGVITNGRRWDFYFAYNTKLTQFVARGPCASQC